MTEAVVRLATAADVSSLNAIYNDYIVDSHVSFDDEPWTDEARAAWLARREADGYPVFVVEVDGSVVGAAWSGPWRDKAAYQGTVETTIVLDARSTGQGLGTTLYPALLDELGQRGFHQAIAIVALPNDASVGLHRHLGFTDVGTLDEVGFTTDRFVSTLLLQRPLGTEVENDG